MQLPPDVVGQLLLLLQQDDVISLRLVCRAWHQAVDRQIRVVRPLYLPPSTPAVFSGCEVVQLPLVRQAAGDLNDKGMTWHAPVEVASTIYSSMPQATELDLSGQFLRDNVLDLLSRHLTRLRSLRLSSCTLFPAQLCGLAGFARNAADDELGGLQNLNLQAVIVVSKPLYEQALARWPFGKFVGPDGHLAATAADVAPPAANGAGGAAVVQSLQGPSAEHDRAAAILRAIAANPLTRLVLQARPPSGPNPLWNVGGIECWPRDIDLAGYCSCLQPLCSTLLSLDIVGQRFNNRDWGVLTDSMALLTELKLTWFANDDSYNYNEEELLQLDAEAFSSIGKLRRLRGLHLYMQTDGLVYEPYSLAPVSQHLTSLLLASASSLPLVLSLMDCRNLQQLQLHHLQHAVGSPELIIHLVRSLPLLQSLELDDICNPSAERVGLFLGDQLLSQLDCCCPHLTRLVMRGIDVSGVGLRMVATGSPPTPRLPAPVEPSMPRSSAAAAATAGFPCVAHSSRSMGTAAVGCSGACGVNGVDAPPVLCDGLPGSGGLRRLKHLELRALELMVATLPHLSCCVDLEQLVLTAMPPQKFSHACRLDCFRQLSALTGLTSLIITGTGTQAASLDGQLAGQLPVQGPQLGPGAGAGAAAAAAAAAAGAGAGAGVPVAPVAPVAGFADSDSADDDTDLDSQGGSSGDDGSEDGSSSSYETVEGDEQEHEGELAAAAAAADALPGGAQAVLGPAAAAAAVAAAGALAGLHGDGHAGPVLQGVLQQAQEQQGMAAADVEVPQDLLAVLAALAAQQQQQQPEPGEGLPAVGQAAAEPLVPPVPQLLLGQAQQQVAGLPQQPDVMLPQGGQPQGLAPAQLGGLPAGLVEHAQELLANARRAPLVEPHLHFVSSMSQLMELDLCCLSTTGVCLTHLNSLTRLTSLSLAGCIILPPRSLQLLQQLHLPSVQQLSIKGCGVQLHTTTNPLSLLAAAAGGQPSGTAAAAAPAALGTAHSSSSSMQASRQLKASSMDLLIPVLTSAFPGCVNLQLGFCNCLSIVGLADLLRGLPCLQRLWLLYVPLPRAKQLGLPPPPPFNFEPIMQQRQQQQQARVVPGGQPQPQLQAACPAPPVGWVLPLEAAAVRSRNPRPLQDPEDLEWFLEEAVVFTQQQVAQAHQAQGQQLAASPGTAEMPQGAVPVPFRAGSRLKYVQVGRRAYFTRDGDTLERHWLEES